MIAPLVAGALRFFRSPEEADGKHAKSPVGGDPKGLVECSLAEGQARIAPRSSWTSRMDSGYLAPGVCPPKSSETTQVKYGARGAGIEKADARLNVCS